jgi:hypothetical protein
MHHLLGNEISGEKMSGQHFYSLSLLYSLGSLAYGCGGNL